MKKHLLLGILFNLNLMLISAESKYPADVSFMVCDFKYSQEHGLKICEVQHGALSVFKGDLYISGGDGIIAPKIADFFTSFPIKKWAMGLTFLPLKRSLAAKDWDVKHSFSTLLNDPEFLQCAAVPPDDPSFITSYKGIVYADSNVIRKIDAYRQAYPGILFMNTPTFPSWRDKYKMNSLFELNDELKQYKADWRLYPKKYDSLLSQRIQEEMPSDFYVIKPRGEFLGNGVIAVASSDLDNVLQMILEPLDSLGNHPDKKYSYWLKNKDKTFLIEKYYKSDYLCFSSPLDKEISSQSEYHYDPTMRIVFILCYDGGKMKYQSFGGFCKLPPKALEEEGSLNEMKTSCGKPAFFRALDPELLQEIDTHMERAMLLLYEIMLSR